MSRARAYAEWFYNKPGAKPFYYSEPRWAVSAAVGVNAVINVPQEDHCKAILVYDMFYTNAGGASAVTGMNGEPVFTSTNVGPTDRVVVLEYFYPNTKILRFSATNGVNVIINVSYQCIFEDNTRTYD